MKTLPKNKKHAPLSVVILSIVVFTIGCENSSDPSLNSQVVDGSTKLNAESEQLMKPQTDIHTAVMTNDLATVKQHVLAGGNIDQKAPFGGSSPLINAALFGYSDIVEFLIKSGTDLNLKNNDGSTEYDSVSGPFQVVKPIYDMIGQALSPMDLVLDYKHLETTRPQIAALLK